MNIFDFIDQLEREGRKRRPRTSSKTLAGREASASSTSVTVEKTRNPDHQFGPMISYKATPPPISRKASNTGSNFSKDFKPWVDMNIGPCHTSIDESSTTRRPMKTASEMGTPPSQLPCTKGDEKNDPVPPPSNRPFCDGDTVYNICPNCGMSFRKREHGKGRQRLFCSKRCSDHYRYVNPTPAALSKLITKNCAYCGKEFSYQSRGNKPSRAYCCKYCGRHARLEREKEKMK